MFTIIIVNNCSLVKKETKLYFHIESLLNLQWWNWDEEKIFNNLERLTSEIGLKQLMEQYLYKTFVYDGGTFKNFGPFETKEELYNALKEYSDAQVTSGIMSQADANDLLKRYK